MLMGYSADRGKARRMVLIQPASHIPNDSLVAGCFDLTAQNI